MISFVPLFVFFGFPLSIALLGFVAMLLHGRKAPPVVPVVGVDPAEGRQASAAIEPSELARLIRTVFETLNSAGTDGPSSRTSHRPETKVD